MTTTFNAWMDEIAEALRPGGAKADAFMSMLRNGYNTPLRDIQILADALGYKLDLTIKSKPDKQEKKKTTS